MSLGVSFETCLRRRGDVLMWRRHYVPMGRHHNIPIGRREDVPLRRLADVPLRRHWVFHFRLVWDVVKTYHWDVLATFHWDVGGCFIWDLPTTSLGRTERCRYDVATTSCCRVGTCYSFRSDNKMKKDCLYFWALLSIYWLVSLENKCFYFGFENI